MDWVWAPQKRQRSHKISWRPSSLRETRSKQLIKTISISSAIKQARKYEKRKQSTQRHTHTVNDKHNHKLKNTQKIMRRFGMLIMASWWQQRFGIYYSLIVWPHCQWSAMYTTICLSYIWIVVCLCFCLCRCHWYFSLFRSNAETNGRPQCEIIEWKQQIQQKSYI